MLAGAALALDGTDGAFCVERCAGWALPDEELGIVDAPMYVANKPLQLFAVAQLEEPDDFRMLFVGLAQQASSSSAPTLAYSRFMK